MYDATTCGIQTSFSGALHLNPSTNSNLIFINGVNTSGLLGVGSAGYADAKLHDGNQMVLVQHLQGIYIKDILV